MGDAGAREGRGRRRGARRATEARGELDEAKQHTLDEAGGHVGFTSLNKSSQMGEAAADGEAIEPGDEGGFLRRMGTDDVSVTASTKVTRRGLITNNTPTLV